MKKVLIIILVFTGLTGFKYNETRSISGTVYDKQDELPIAGVSIHTEGGISVITTNASGGYNIDVPDGKTRLLFSLTGYKDKSVRVGENNRLNVYLEPSAPSNSPNDALNGYTSQNKISAGNITVADIAAANLQPVDNHGQLPLENNNGFSFNNDRFIPSLKKPDVPSTSSVTRNESYKEITENGFMNAKSNPLSTFSVDVDPASYSNVRRFINNGQLPPVNAVRIEELINYFSYNLPGPVNGEPVAIHTELSSAPWNTKHRLLRIGLKARTMDVNKLPPSNLVFLIDVSGSMKMPNKLPLVKASMKLLTQQLRPQDRVAIVTYAGHAGLALASTPGDKKMAIIDAINDLKAGGSTAGGAGIKLAYRIAKENFMDKGNNRIIMATDGDFNVGLSTDGDMEQLIVRERESNVAISIMGFGMGNLKDSKMETLADRGNGNYAYIDNMREAKKALVTEFAGTLYTVAKDVKLQIEFNPANVQSYRLLGYEDRMLNKEDFNNDKKDAGDIGSGHTVTALYEIVPTVTKNDFSGLDALKDKKSATAGKSPDELLTIKFRYKENNFAASKISRVIVKDAPKDLKSASVDFRFAASVAEFGMLLRKSPYKEQSTFAQAISIAEASKGEDKDGYRSEFVKLAESAQLLATGDYGFSKD